MSRAEWLAAVQDNWQALRDAPPAVRADRKVVLAAVGRHGGALRFAARALQGDREVVLAAVQSNGEALQFASEKLQADRVVVLAAVRQNGGALRDAAESLLADRVIVAAAVRQSGRALADAAAELRADKVTVMAAVRQSGDALAFAAQELRTDPEVVLAAIQNDGEALYFAAPELRDDREFVLAAVKRNGNVLRFTAEEFQADEQVVEAAVKQNPDARKFAAPELRKAPGKERKAKAESASTSLEQSLAGVDVPIAKQEDGARGISDNDLHAFKARLQAVEATGEYQGYDQALGEALQAEPHAPGRIAGIMEAAFGAVGDLAKSGSGRACGEALLYALFLLAVSASLDEVRVRRGGRGGAGCALVLGWGGSHVEDLEPRVDFYQSLGLATLCLAPCLGPQGRARRQRERVAQELRALLEGGGALVVHVCSNVGMGCWINFMAAWTAAAPPCDALPPLQQCLRALVFECAPFSPVDPATGEVLPPNPVSDPTGGQHVGPAAAPPPLAPAPPGAHVQVDMLVTVMQGCLGAFCRRHAPAIKPFSLAQDADFMRLLRGAASNGPFLLARGEPDFGDYGAWERMDLAMEPPVPRLFLYSANDQLFPPALIEAYLRHTARYNPKAEVYRERCELSAHCKLWETERERCAAAVSRMLRRGNVIA